jgi:N-acetylmuramoyl-L-alanine amidase/Putative peptidoglycan binding domain
VTVIAYDRPVKDLIAQLSATGHVTHTAYRKTSVTLHHNGGRLSHEGVLNVWKTREASAQFDSDALGEIAQFTNVNEYAWACGNTDGNMHSIHIEMANSKVAPTWEVSEVTWQGAARLAGWLFAKVIGERPSTGNFFVHKHWYATACAGPYIDGVYSQILDAANRSYEFFKFNPTASKPVPSVPVKAGVVGGLRAPGFPLPSGWYFGPESGPRESVSGLHGHQGALGIWQRRMADRGWSIVADGFYGDQTAKVTHDFQTEKHLTVDSRIGAQTWAAAWTSPVN